MKELFLLRGLPGSGKSTLAKSLMTNYKEHYYREADMYFIDKNGDYKFDPSQLKEAHTWCQEEVSSLIEAQYERITVSNTFTQEWEMQPYFDLAEKYGYRVHSLIVENRHGGVNEHGVPEEKLVQMKQRFEIKL
jgi:predicted kinase